jgi:small subunit ribosomal protein S17
MAEEKKQMKIVRSHQGTVVSTKMQDTAVVTIVSKKVHSKYKKAYKSTVRFNCHNKDNKYKVGDVVTFQECRPMSKTKRWRIIAKVK